MPVMKDAASLARKHTASATSAIVPKRPIGCILAPTPFGDFNAAPLIGHTLRGYAARRDRVYPNTVKCVI